MQSTNQGSIISVRTSDASFKTVSSGGWDFYPTTQQSNGYRNYHNHVNTWNHVTLPVSTPTGKTTSFSSIHQEVIQDLSSQLQAEIKSAPRRVRGENPGGAAVGDNTVPVGDMLLPLLAMAVAYIVIKLFRNRKTSKAL